MIIKTQSRNIEALSISDATMSKEGKVYPALEIIFDKNVKVEDIETLLSETFIAKEKEYEGYNTIGEVSIIIGKITSVEQERDNLASELTSAKVEHEQYKDIVETILPKLDDETALTVATLFPTWEECLEVGAVNYKVGFRFSYKGKLYKCKHPNPSFQSDWVPGEGTEVIYERIDETHFGTIDDPIPYDGNMVLENGKYYTQDGIIYLCNRNTENPVYHTLAELVGQYVEVYAE